MGDIFREVIESGPWDNEIGNGLLQRDSLFSGSIRGAPSEIGGGHALIASAMQRFFAESNFHYHILYTFAATIGRKSVTQRSTF